MDPTQNTPQNQPNPAPPAPQPAVLESAASTTPTPTPFIPGQNVPPAANQGPLRFANGQPAPAKPAAHPNSTQNSLQIAEIRDGIVIMNDGSFRSVVMVKSINFDLMSAQEQEGVEYGYQGFLNSLYFPIQIFIHSQKIDLGPYIA